MRLERVAAGIVAGAAAGVLCGVVARIAMRSVALGLLDASMQVPIFTVQGTLAILMSGAIVGAPFGIGYALLADSVRLPRVTRGLLFAVILVAAFGPLFFLGTDEFVSTGRVLAFIWLFPIFGIAVSLVLPVAQPLAASMPRAAHGALMVGAAGGAVLIVTGIAGIVGQSLEKNGPAALALFAAWPVLVVLAALVRRARAPLTAEA